VTDADLLLGYIPNDYFLGGEMKLDVELARRAMKGISERLGLSLERAAQAIFTSVNSFMADQITEVSTKRGHDVREFVLVAGGGAGPVHAVFIADLLGIPTVVIPSVAALYSAFGMFAMDLGSDYARSYVSRTASADLSTMTRLYEAMESEAIETFKAMGVRKGEVTLRRTADMRYIGQFHEVETEMASGHLTPKKIDGAVAAFNRKHESLYAFSMPWKGVEVLTLRVKATAPKVPFRLRQIESGSVKPERAFKRRRRSLFGGREIETPVYDGERLRAGNVLSGPVIIEESTTTVVIPKGFRCEVDKFKNYVLRRRGAGRGGDS
jgi:N-methylhydantoinase A